MLPKRFETEPPIGASQHCVVFAVSRSEIAVPKDGEAKTMPAKSFRVRRAAACAKAFALNKTPIALCAMGVLFNCDIVTKKIFVKNNVIQEINPEHFSWFRAN